MRRKLFKQLSAILALSLLLAGFGGVPVYAYGGDALPEMDSAEELKVAEEEPREESGEEAFAGEPEEPEDSEIRLLSETLYE